MNEFPRAPSERQFIDELLDAFPALVLSGAGISAGSGIPTYRDQAGTWLRSQPITHQEFIKDPRQRQRYWGRSLLGWPAVRDARPAPAHESLVQLEDLGAITGIVTQNVDRLHQRAGSLSVTDLHGRLDRVCCLDCGHLSSRDQLQQTLEDLNPGLNHQTVAARPDGDADLADVVVDRVQVPRCEKCGGTLMPDVVFFGGSIPRQRVADARQTLEQSNSLLVIGSSLQVYSGYRFCRWASELDKPIFLMNPGLTRADKLASKWNIDADTGLSEVLQQFLEREVAKSPQQKARQ